MAIYQLKENSLFLDTIKPYVLRIKDLPEHTKPREKLVSFGLEALSSAELLSIILNAGTKREGVKAMSERIFKEYGEKAIGHQTNPQALSQELDIPLTKACQIVACFELGRRFFNENHGRKTIIRTAKQAFAHLKDMQDLPKEHLRGLYLNSRYRLIHDEVISVGSLTSNIVHPREVFRPAIEHGAVAVIIAHNHPSGSLSPTESDRTVTEQLIKAGSLLGIDVIDHIIIANNKFISILEPNI